MKKLVVIIPARKGSKRLKNKNYLTLGSKKLVERTILFAKKLVNVKCIILSTDSHKIKKIGEKLKILAPWIRPKRLSKDNSSTLGVVLHASDWYEKNVSKIDSILLLQPTTPFRNLKFFKKMIKKFFRNKNNNLVSVHKIDREKISKKNLLFKKKVINGNKKENYKINGSLYLISLKQLRKKKKFINNRSFGVPISSEKFQLDIDYLKDLKKAKTYVNN